MTDSIVLAREIDEQILATSLEDEEQISESIYEQEEYLTILNEETAEYILPLDNENGENNIELKQENVISGVTPLVPGDNIQIKNNVISVITTSDVEGDNTRPITSAGVYATVGNINELLKTI